jgi:cytochrome c-type biogenesis protein CcmF
VLGYGKDAGKRLARALVVPAIMAVLVVIGFVIKGVNNPWALACTAICTLVVGNVLISLGRAVLHRIRENGENPLTALVRLLDGNHRRYGGQIVHLGVMLMVAGITASSLFSNKQSFQMSPGQSVQLGGMTLTMVELRETRNVNFMAVEAVVKLVDANGEETVLNPQRRFYDKAEEANSEVAIQTGWKQDVYVTLAGWEEGGKVTAIETIINPLVSWIWVGGIVLTIGTIFSLLPKMLPAAAIKAEQSKETEPVVAGRPAAAV